MVDLEFDWDDEKNRINRAKHGWDFRDAAYVFLDPSIHSVEDRSLAYGEQRHKATGYAGFRLVTVIYTERNGIVRLISAHKPSPQERRDYESKVADLKKLPPGRTDWGRIDAMTDEEAEANALADPDSFPTTETSVPTAYSRMIRLRLMLTQEEFAARYHIPLGTLRDWEQHRTEPDQAAQAYLKVIAREPDMVAQALAQGTPAAAE